MNLYVCSGNQKKLEQFRIAFKNSGLDEVVITAVDATVDEIQGDLRTISMVKAKESYKWLLERGSIKENDYVVVDDTAFSFDVWNGLPGPYVKHF